MNITPDIIPHDEFHKGSWLQSEERPGWYYFLERETKHKIKNRDFFRSVDKPLRELVRFLHRKGICTTPSCSGHHFPEKDFERTYAELEADREGIRSRGLWFVDAATRERFFYQNESYELPWNREEFIARLAHYQQKGVIGMHAGDQPERVSRLLRVLRAEMIKGVHVEQRCAVLLIFTTGNAPGDNACTWNKVTRSIKRALRFDTKDF